MKFKKGDRVWTWNYGFKSRVSRITHGVVIFPPTEQGYYDLDSDSFSKIRKWGGIKVERGEVMVLWDDGDVLPSPAASLYPGFEKGDRVLISDGRDRTHATVQFVACEPFVDNTTELRIEEGHLLLLMYSGDFRVAHPSVVSPAGVMSLQQGAWGYVCLRGPHAHVIGPRGFTSRKEAEQHIANIPSEYEPMVFRLEAP